MDGQFFTGFSAFLLHWYLPLTVTLAAAFSFHLVRLPAGRRLYTASMTLYFFLIITSYWILKPLKKAAFIGHYKLNASTSGLAPAQMELLAKELNVAVALLAALALIWLHRRFSGHGYAVAVTLLLAAGLALLIPAAAQPGGGFAWALYLFGDVYVSCLVALFFTTLHDHASMTDTRSIYGLIGLGGVIGGVIGSLSAGELSQLAGLGGAMQVSLGLTLCISLVAWQVGRRHTAHNASPFKLDPDDNRSLFHGAQVIRQSPTLILIATVLLMYEITSVMLDYQFTAMVSETVAPAELKNYFSAVFSFTNCMAIVVQLLLTTWVLKRFGAIPALFVMPLAVAVAAGSFLLVPVLLTASLLNTADGAFAYSIQQTARESLYVPLDRHEKYEAKAFLDVVWLRFAKGLAVLLSLALSLLVTHSAVYMGLIILALVLAWVLVLRKIVPTILSHHTHQSQAHQNLDTIAREPLSPQ